jgi:hypothetical protein
MGLPVDGCANWRPEDNKFTNRIRPEFLECVRPSNKDAAFLHTLSYLVINLDGTFKVDRYAYQVELVDLGKGVDHPMLRKELLRISGIPCTVTGNILSLSPPLTVCFGIIAAAVLPSFSRKLCLLEAGKDGDDLSRSLFQCASVSANRAKRDQVCGCPRCRCRDLSGGGPGKPAAAGSEQHGGD